MCLAGGAALQDSRGVLPTDDPAAHLLRVTADDPEYRRLAAAEAAFWRHVHPMSLEATEPSSLDGPVERYVNTRFTGDPHTDWTATIPRWGSFRRGLLLGAQLAEARDPRARAESPACTSP